MRENHEFIGLVEDYLAEFDGDTPLPGRVVDAIHAELPQTRQVKAGPGFMRMPSMLSTVSSRAPLGIAAAVIVVAVVIGASFMNRGTDQGVVGGAPTPTPTLTPAAQASPTSAPTAGTLLLTLEGAPEASCPGITEQLECIEPGTYWLGSTDVWPAVVTLAVPENWWYYLGGPGQAGVLVQTEDALGGSGWGVIFTTVGSVSTDPCDTAAGIDKDVRTASELYDLISAWPGFTAGAPEPISSGSSNGLRFTLSSTKTTADCPASIMWTTANSFVVDAYPVVNAQGRRHEVEFRVFEIDGELLTVMAMNFPETSPFEEDGGIPFDPQRHADHLVDMDAILDSIRIEPAG